MFGFNASIADEPVKGVPKFIRTVSPDVTMESEFDHGGKLIEQRTFRPDGSLTYRTTYKDRLTTMFDATGTEVSRIERTCTESGWEEVTVGADGKRHTQTARIDGAGRVIESQHFAPDGGVEARYEGVFDAHGNLAGADVTLGDVAVKARQDGDRTIMLSYGSDGTMLSQTETSRAGDLATCLTTLPFQRLKTERMERRDSVGNWLSKTLFESNDPNQIGEAVSTVERTITYW